ncbi:hypothetical protein DCE94_08325 [Agromyces badenianii]|nr:hypothetical protein DCE94_08325 [Agromyces badenianii]
MKPAARPPHLRWAPIGLVVVGGALGTASRAGLSLVIPNLADVPLSIAIINVVGAFVLGYLSSSVTFLGADSSTAKNLKLLLGTGFCGGFTTYSSLAIDTAVLIMRGSVGVSLLYSLGTVTVGGLATWLGLVAGSSVSGRKARTTNAEAAS